MYEYGLGVGENQIRAALWIERAAIAGFDRAQYNMGKRYRDGQGVEINKEMSARWFLAAARQGYSKAQSLVGTRFMKGDGLEKDLVEALKWLRLAAQQGEKSAAEIADKLQADMTDEQLAQSERRIATFTPERASVY